MARRSVSSRLAPVLVARAAVARSALTPSEAALWSALSGCQLGVWFRRQVPIGRFIADFCAPSVALVVEVDGSSHAGRGARDARRDRVLVRLGWRVVRVPAALVLRELPRAVAVVRAAVEARRG